MREFARCVTCIVLGAGGTATRAAAQGAGSLLERVVSLQAPAIAPDGRRIAYVKIDRDPATGRDRSEVWISDLTGSGATRAGEGTDPAWAPDGSALAWRSIAVGVVVIAPATALASPRSLDGTAGATTFRWSGDGKAIAFTAAFADSSAATVRVVRGVERAIGPTRLFVITLGGGAPRAVTPDSITVGTVDAGSMHIPFDWLGPASLVFEGRAPAHAGYLASALFAVDVASGFVRALTVAPGLWHSPSVAPDGKTIAYLGFAETRASYRTQDVWVMRPDGASSRLLTRGFDRDASGLRWSDNQVIWFHAQDRGTVNSYSVSLKDGKVRPGSNGAHRLIPGSVNGREKVGVAIRSAPGHPDEIYRYALGRPWDIVQVTHINDSVVAALGTGETEDVEFRSADGTVVHGWLSRPAQFDPARRWPLVAMVHDGPHGMHDAGFDPVIAAMAARGWMVLRLNVRGSTGYGTDFGNRLAAFPSADVDDLLAGVDEIIRQGSVDTTRVYLRGCGSGAVAAVAALARSTRFAAASLECEPSFLAHSVRTTHATFLRPWRADALEWLAQSPVRDVGRIRVPVLFVVRAGTAPEPADQRALLYQQLALRGVPVAWLEWSGEATERSMVEREVARWFDSATR